MDSPARAVSGSFLFFLITLTVVLSGCSAHKAKSNDPTNGVAQKTASTPQMEEDVFELEDEFATAEEETVSDPLSGYNRMMTHVNDKIYFWLLKPVAQGYRAVVPEGARLAVGRFFTNLGMPVRFVNNLLQLKPKQAGTELARFALNSTVGILGFADPAANNFDLQAYPEDFGQTLGYYGVGSGFHIVLPLLGPSNLRDTVGLVPDYFLDPITYVDDTETRLAIRGYKTVNYTSLHIGEYENLKKDAVDPYIFFRDGYEQRRNHLIKE
jgi:phospholipid-binding lipoprotein MlaA